MLSNKVEYSAATGPYYTTHDINVPFCMPEFSIRKIIPHHFHVDNYKGKSGIGYDIIIGNDLMVQLGPSSNFKCQLLQWYGVDMPMEESRGLLGKTDLNSRDMCEMVM